MIETKRVTQEGKRKITANGATASEKTGANTENRALTTNPGDTKHRPNQCFPGAAGFSETRRARKQQPKKHVFPTSLNSPAPLPFTTPAAGPCFVGCLGRREGRMSTEPPPNAQNTPIHI